MTKERSPFDRETILLLCATIQSSRSNESSLHKPLTSLELLKLEQRIESHAQNDFLESLADQNFYEGWASDNLNAERIQYLLGRKFSLGIYLEKSAKEGIHLISKVCQTFPELLFEKLQNRVPPIFYSVGEPEFYIQSERVAMVGSRNCPSHDLERARKITSALVRRGAVIVSGGAKGVDEESTMSALASGGAAISIVSDSLLRKSKNRELLPYLRTGQLIMVSPYQPKAPFNVGTAMGRNKLIYALSHNSIVIHSGKTGGTWEGAKENLGKAYSKLWVFDSQDKSSANKDLIKLGANKLPESFELDPTFPIIESKMTSLAKGNRLKNAKQNSLFAMPKNK